MPSRQFTTAARADEPPTPHSETNSTTPIAGSVTVDVNAESITRISRACERCRRRKIRCNGAQPCAGCAPDKSTCLYRTGRPRVRSRRVRASVSTQEKLPEVSCGLPIAVPTAEQAETQCPWYHRCCVGISVSNPTTGCFQVYGPSSQLAFLQRVFERLMMCQATGAVNSEAQIPTAIRNWRLEQFLFNMPRSVSPQPDSSTFLPRHLGDLFIRYYFKLVHPQLPILDYDESVSQWEELWKVSDELRKDRRASLERKDILFMTLAIGARVCPVMNEDGLKVAEAWGEHFSRRVELPLSALEEPSMHLVRLFILKAVYAQHAVRTNDSYMYLGYAARTALAIGIHRPLDLQTLRSADAPRVSLTFWTVYTMERTTALMIGRPSSLRDEFIAAPYPSGSLLSVDSRQVPLAGVINDWAYVQSMAMLGGLADQILTGIYNTGGDSCDTDHFLAENMILESEARLQGIISQLPAQFDLANSEAPISEDWQEVQRLHLGIIVNTMRMLIHRPALVFNTFFSSITEAQSNTTLQLRQSIGLCIGSAKGVIRFIYESLSSRIPDARSDGSPAIFLVTACLTILFHVLDPATTPDIAKDCFLAVDQAIQCLEGMKHLGPTTGKMLSRDIMSMAQNVISSATGQSLIAEDQNLTAEYPWLE